MRVPIATYRVQFNQDFRFPDALEIVPLLHRLGVTHLYASPIWAAREGTTHGYDVIDPNRLNPVLGSAEDFEQLVDALRSRDMGLIADIVPNHMAASPENSWWMDVLENGPASRYAGYFGINWSALSQSPQDKIFLPILGGPFGAVLDRGELRLTYEDGGLFIRYYDHKFPVAPSSYSVVLGPGSDALSDIPEFQRFKDSVSRLPPITATDWEAMETRHREIDHLKAALWALYQNEPRLRAHVDSSVMRFNGTPGDPRSFDAFEDLIANQSYRLAYWRVATEKINYRRFFDVSDLIALRVENPEVFRASHALVFDLLSGGAVDGLRIDHIDGLADPEAYLKNLPSDSTYVVAEKILVGEERLPRDWKLHGTTGYDFLGYMNAMFVDPEGLAKIEQFYSAHTEVRDSLMDVEYNRKMLITSSLFSGEMADLGARLGGLAEQDRYARDFSPQELSRGLKEITACLPVYRTYTNSPEVPRRDRPYLALACDEARKRAPQVDPLVYDFICRVLTLAFRRTISEEAKSDWVRFVIDWQQLTGPIMAKGVEDSTFYVYNPLVSLNEVGGLSRPVPVEEFHRFLAERREQWPHTMNASSTHDTKRSEDVRARINVLSEIPDEWSRLVSRWSRWLRNDRRSVDRNEEYFYLQNLIGAWPLFPTEVGDFRERLKNYSTKAAREAREHTSWLAPNEQHEQDLRTLIDAMFQHEQFLSSFLHLQQKVAFYGAVNSLSQVLLKITSPGLPDFYRGTIGWDFSLVDPDNRRPIPFPSLTDFEEPARSMLEHWQDGKVKVFLTEHALAFRRSNAALFSDGEYIPLEVVGKRAGNLFAFARRHEDLWSITAVPRLVSKLATVLRFPIGVSAWRDTEVRLPEHAPVRWKNVITGAQCNGRNSALPVHRMLEQFPVALLASK